MILQAAALLLALLVTAAGPGSPGILAPPSAAAQGAPAGARTVPGESLRVQGGAVEVGLLLRQMTGTRRVLVVGAHPDDEDTALLAELNRHRGVRAAYLSLTRGEGGQNLIGPELGKGLGLIRTGELLAARRLDGSEQFFTRAYDFGYSKTAEETFGHWPRDTLVSDVVWVIRTFRPHVVVSVFTGTSADGHGQHQAAGIVTREAFRAAGDTARFPEHMAWGARPWSPDKLYRRAWRDPENATLHVATGEYDPLLGRSPFQLAMESRSQHRSQDFGTAEPPGPRFTRLVLLENRTSAASEASLFAGIDTALASLAHDLPAERRPALRRHLEVYERAVERARDSLRVLDPEAAGPALARALRAIREAEELLAAPDLRDAAVAEVLARKRRLAERALMAARGLTVRFRAGTELWVQGGTVRVHATLWNGGDGSVRAGPPDLELPEGWDVRLLPPDSARSARSELSRFYAESAPVKGGTGPVEVPAGALARWTFELRVPRNADPTEPYFLARDTVGDLYRWPSDGRLRARPLDPPTAVGRLSVTLEQGGQAVGVRARSPVRYRGVDKARGEFWRPVHVVPRASVEVEPGVAIWPSGPGAGSSPRAGGPDIEVSVRSLVGETMEPRLSVETPFGLSVVPASTRVRLEGAGSRESASFRLAGEGDVRTFRLRARAEEWTRTLTLVDYPHIDPVPFYEDAEVRLERFPVQVDRERRVGYVMGSGDEGPAAIRQLDLSVEMLEPERLRSGDFDGLDVIVLGVRAYEVREDLQSANERLLDWVRGGGTLLVQYNKYEFEEGGFAPFEVSMARPHDRVTDERSPVTLLQPDAPVLSSPNRITARDFEGWIQERGLYFLHTWPDEMTPLLAMRDPGEEPKRGGLLAAPLGEGVYLYTGLAFFRQLPAGVPGAYRLFANLLSLEPAEWRRWLEGRDSGGRR